MSAPTGNLAYVGEVVGAHLTEIAALFKPGMKLTILARMPEKLDGSCDFVLTSDNLHDAIHALTQRMEAER